MIHFGKKPADEVFLDKQGIVRAVYHGPQTAAMLESTVDRIMKIMIKLVAQDKPVKLLVDIRDLGGYDRPAMLVEMHARTILPFWKMALITTDALPEGEKVSRQITAMSGRRGEIRYFQREDDAIGWLSFMRDGRGAVKEEVQRIE